MPAIRVADRPSGPSPRAGARLRRLGLAGALALASLVAVGGVAGAWGDPADRAPLDRPVGAGAGHGTVGDGDGALGPGPSTDHGGSSPGGPGGGSGGGFHGGGPGGGSGGSDGGPGAGPGGGWGGPGSGGGGHVDDDHGSGSDDDGAGHDEDDGEDEAGSDDDAGGPGGQVPGAVTDGAPVVVPPAAVATALPAPAAILAPPAEPLVVLADAEESRLQVDPVREDTTPPPATPSSANGTAPLSAVDPPLSPFVPDNGWGWGLVGALLAAAVAGFAFRHATLRGAIRDARQSATRDPLTGLANRRLFDEILTRELVRAQRRASSVALLLVDLDGFKKVNDTRGHAAGDEVLRSVGETLTGRVRGADLPARLGGDEFAVVLPDCPPDAAARVAEDLRAQIASVVGPAVTASVGVAAVPAHAGDAAHLMAAADAALYRAKADGRNRVVVAAPGVATAG